MPRVISRPAISLHVFGFGDDIRNSLVISHRRQEAESQERLINQLQVTFADVGATNQQQAQVGQGSLRSFQKDYWYFLILVIWR